MIAEAWQVQLTDRVYVQTLLYIIEYGAKIGYRGPDQLILSENLSSADEAPETLQADLNQQYQCDRLTEVHQIPERFISSPLGLVPKGDGR